MLRLKSSIIALAIAATFMAAMPSEANADGPLRRWLRGLWNPNANASANCCGTQQAAPQAFAPTTANFTPNSFGLQPGQCMKTCQQTCSRTVVNYVPQTAYRTAWNRVPVTQYRPVTNSDPCTGCTVTCMRPCTTYTYQMQRVPYTTYRPVYRQETYKVPVTTITNDCATGNCGTGCATCVTPQQAPAANFAPQVSNFAPIQQAAPVPAPTTSTYYELAPGTLSTQGGFSTQGNPTPADIAPSTNGGSGVLDGVSSPITTQRPVIDRVNQGTTYGGFNYQTSSPINNGSNAPAMINIQDKTAQSPARKQWAYSPVRMASYSKPAATTTRAIAPARKSWSSNRKPVMINRPSKNMNGWVEVN